MMIKYFVISMMLLGLIPLKVEAKQIKRPEIVSMHIIDRNGFSETITTKDRLKNFEKTNFLNPQSYQKVLRVYSRDQKGSIPAFITTYHPNGQIKQYLEILNSQAHGLYQEWYGSGQVKLHTHVLGGTADLVELSQASWLFDGESVAYDESGARIAEIHYNKGVLDGESIYYHSNGTISTKIPYCNGVVNGEVTLYGKSGELLQKSLFVDGQLDGPSLSFWPGGQIAAKEEFYEGLLLTASYFNEKEELVASIADGEGKRMVLAENTIKEIQEFQNGKQYGFVWQYNKNGKLESLYRVKEEGIKQGEEILYYPTGKPKLAIEWFDGLIQGTVKSWYFNGAQESAKEMSKNKKQGLSTAWYPTGDLMLFEEYDQDKLIKGSYFKKGERTAVSTVVDGCGTATLFDKEGTLAQKITYDKGRPTLDR